LHCGSIRAMDEPKDLIGRLMYLPGGVKVRVEHIYEDEDPVIARTRRVGGPHDDIPAYIEVTKLEPGEFCANPQKETSL
jgi:hypothetical protein